MVQLELLSGKKAGQTQLARHFPVRIGREAKAHVQLDDEGVWDDHARIELQPGEGFVLKAHEDALMMVNGEPERRALLKSGDRIQLGGASLRFWLAPTRQRGFKAREWCVWIGIAAVSLAQIAIIYWLILQ